MYEQSSRNCNVARRRSEVKYKIFERSVLVRRRHPLNYVIDMHVKWPIISYTFAYYYILHLIRL